MKNQKNITDNTESSQPVIAAEDKYKFITQLEDLTDKIPEDLVIKDDKWKFICRNILRGQHVLFTGMSGSGKTKTSRAAADALNRPFFYFNLGATQDPRSALIGDVHYSEEEGTYLSKSEFIDAITTPHAVILLDEVTRAHPDAWNILLTITDPLQQYVRLDESSDRDVIHVAEGVSFVGTANIGNEYTATRVLDRAYKERFHLIEMDVLKKDEEVELLSYLFPSVSNTHIDSIAEIATQTRDLAQRDDSVLETAVSTRLTVRIADLLSDGFSLKQAAELVIYPFFSSEGGENSERARVGAIIEKYIDDDSSDDLFREDDIDGVDLEDDEILN